MQKHQITLQLLGRNFPINVTPEEEPRIRLVAQLIQEKLDSYRRRFNITDDVYLTLMTCMDITAEYLKITDHQEAQEQALETRLQALNDTLHDAAV
ncbi:MAG: cell division protein ZapA [Bacteroidetes bacterium]|nr:cell division protein ZapA [Bacteroidota bacterium]